MDDDIGRALAPVDRESAPLRRNIIRSLRIAIETGGLKPGARLVEKELCQLLGVSRTSLREALRELVAEGLVVNSTSRGLMVAGIGPREAANIYRVRGALEAMVAEQFAADASPAALAALERAADRLERAYLSGRMSRILAAKTEFYECFCAGADNDVVLDILRRLNSRISQLRAASLARPERATASIAEIRALMAALRCGDPAAAAAAAACHVENAARAALVPQRDPAPRVPSRSPA